MKRKIAALLLAACLCLPTSQINASSYKDLSYMINSGEYYKIEATAYYLTGQTATGTFTRPGVVAYSPSLYGMTVMIWTTDWEFLGYYEIEDTGCQRIQDGEVMDVWLPTYDECIEFGRKEVYIQVFDAKG